MKKIAMTKVQHIFAKMDDKFWEDVTAKCAELSRRLPEILEEFTDACTKLTVAQMNILEAKFEGYQRLIECKDETEREQVAGENKSQITDLSHSKSEISEILSTLLIDMQVVIEEINNLGENALRPD